jgi:hypothetical protein
MAPGMGLLLFTTFSSTCDHRLIRAARTMRDFELRVIRQAWSVVLRAIA